MENHPSRNQKQNSLEYLYIFNNDIFQTIEIKSNKINVNGGTM